MTRFFLGYAAMTSFGGGITWIFTCYIWTQPSFIGIAVLGVLVGITAESGHRARESLAW